MTISDTLTIVRFFHNVVLLGQMAALQNVAAPFISVLDEELSGLAQHLSN